jgi:hypothetical protein
MLLERGQRNSPPEPQHEIRYFVWYGEFETNGIVEKFNTLDVNIKKVKRQHNT